MDADTEIKRLGWLVEIDGQPLAWEHPLDLPQAVQVFELYAHRLPDHFVELRQVNAESTTAKD